jgi:hypothetical protein
LPPIQIQKYAAEAPLEGNPVPWLLQHLLLFVGPPLFVTSSTSPLLQSWFARAGHPRSRDPYFLSMASNAGSLIALLAYPFLVEPYLGVRQQAYGWTALYLVYLVLIVGCAPWRAREAEMAGSVPEPVGPRPSVRERLGWLALSFIPSSLLAGTTFYLSELISVIPLLWILPLALYLLSLIVAFSEKSAAYRGSFWTAAALLLVPWGATSHEASYAIWLVLPVHLAGFFAVSLALHTELAARRPRVAYLAEFYLWMAAGGALGGLFNGIVAPAAFALAYEYPVALIAAAVALIGVGWWTRPRWALAAPALALVGLALGFRSYSLGMPPLYVERNFFGITRVVEDAEQNRYLFHNGYMQSKQAHSLPERNEPYAYLSRDSGIGEVLQQLNRDAAGKEPPNLAVIGLGAGVIATYALPKSHWTFFEINPAVVRVAHQAPLFSYLQDSPAAKVDVILGDARRTFTRVPDHHYRVVVIDAFNSTAMPVHLLTREALAQYLTKTTAEQTIGFNNVSRLFDLESVVCRVGQEFELGCYVRTDGDGWIFVSRDPTFWEPLVASGRWRKVAPKPELAAWTDEFSNPAGVVQWPRLRKARELLGRLTGK